MLQLMKLCTLLLVSFAYAASQRWNKDNWPQPVYGHTWTSITLQQQEGSANDTVREPYGILFGGWPWDPTANSNNEMYVYSFSQFKWLIINVENVPLPRHYHSSVSSSDGDFLFMFGGIRGNEYLNNTYMLDCRTDPAWSVLDATCDTDVCISGRFGHSASLFEELGEEILYKMIVFGGMSSSNRISGSVHILNIKMADQFSASWELAFNSSMQNSSVNAPIGRYFHSSTFYNDTVYIFGGTNNGVNPVKDPFLYAYSVQNNSWLAKIEVTGNNPDDILPSTSFYEDGIFGHSAIQINLEVDGAIKPVILFSGGFTNLYSSDVIVYRLTSNSWVVLKDPVAGIELNTPTPRRNMALCENSGLLYQFGGNGDVEYDELNVMSFTHDKLKFSDQTEADGAATSNPFNAFWTSCSIESFEVAASDNLLNISISGWGFSEENDISFTNSIKLYSYENPNDLSTALNVEDAVECIQTQSNSEKVSCVTSFFPVGYFAVVVDVRSFSGEVFGQTSEIAFKCLRPGFNVSTLSSSTGDQLEACVPIPRIDSISPDSGVGGDIVELAGENLSDELEILVGDSPCVILDFNSSLVSCTISDNIATKDATVRATTSLKAENSGVLYSLSLNISTDLEFEYLFFLSSISTNVTEIEGAFTASFTFSGKGFNSESLSDILITISNTPVTDQNCIITMVTNDRFACSLPLASRFQNYEVVMKVFNSGSEDPATVTIIMCDSGEFQLESGSYVPQRCYNIPPTPTPVTSIVLQTKVLMRTDVVTETKQITQLLKETMVVDQTTVISNSKTTTINIPVTTVKTEVVETYALTVRTIRKTDDAGVLTVKRLETKMQTIKNDPASEASWQVPVIVSTLSLLLILFSMSLILLILSKRRKVRRMRIHDDEEKPSKVKDIDDIVNEMVEIDLAENYIGSTETLSPN